ncbi:MAG: hypothetical protein AAGI17_06525, partial [Planctomycetota bacterium]
AAFTFREVEHGWFLIEDAAGRPLRIDPDSGVFELSTPGFNGVNVQWHFVRVLGGEPGEPRGVGAFESGLGEVTLAWEPHGFRDLDGMEIRRADSQGAFTTIATEVDGEAFVDQVPAPGMYTYEIRAVGDTGASAFVSTGAIGVQSCIADFNNDFSIDASDTEAAVDAVAGGLDLDGSGEANVFDVIWYLEQRGIGCGN